MWFFETGSVADRDGRRVQRPDGQGPGVQLAVRLAAARPAAGAQRPERHDGLRLWRRPPQPPRGQPAARGARHHARAPAVDARAARLHDHWCLTMLCFRNGGVFMQKV